MGVMNAEFESTDDSGRALSPTLYILKLAFSTN
jgi:hypothetical protein